MCKQSCCDWGYCEEEGFFLFFFFSYLVTGRCFVSVYGLVYFRCLVTYPFYVLFYSFILGDILFYLSIFICCCYLHFSANVSESHQSRLYRSEQGDSVYNLLLPLCMGRNSATFENLSIYLSHLLDLDH